MKFRLLFTYHYMDCTNCHSPLSYLTDSQSVVYNKHSLVKQEIGLVYATLCQFCVLIIIVDIL